VLNAVVSFYVPHLEPSKIMALAIVEQWALTPKLDYMKDCTICRELWLDDRFSQGFEDAESPRLYLNKVSVNYALKRYAISISSAEYCVVEIRS
jgi:hypothetical protein